MLYPAQIRAARALLGWHQAVLARRSKVGLATIQRLERGPEGPVMAHVATVVRISECLKKAGVQFLEPDADGGIGVRLKP
jgi:transcriptional regulator with XRE-family HTH domain